MALFKVVEVVNGNTIKVNGWSWSGHSGNLVNVAGLRDNNHGSEYSEFAKNQLEVLLKDKQVELKGVVGTTGTSPNETIKCSVYLNDIDIAKYFPELKAS